MKRYFSVIIITLFIIPCILNAQGSKEESLRKYEAEKKNEVLAAGLEFFVPILGHAYAGNVEKGLLPAAVSAAGIVLWFVGPTIVSSDVTSFASVATLGVLVYVGGRVWGIVSAYQTAEEYNANLKKRLNISLVPIRSGVGIGLSYSF